MEFHLRLGGLRRHLGGLSHPKPKPIVTSLARRKVTLLFETNAYNRARRNTIAPSIKAGFHLTQRTQLTRLTQATQRAKRRVRRDRSGIYSSVACVAYVALFAFFALNENYRNNTLPLLRQHALKNCRNQLLRCFVAQWLLVSALGIRTRGPRFDSRVTPLFHWVATMGKLFTHIASVVSQLQKTEVQKGSFRRL